MRQRQSSIGRRGHSQAQIFSILNFPLFILLALALGLRLLVWRWHAQYPLGGDEQEYFEQALTLLRTRQIIDLRLMRPPLYTIFLAACSYLFDSQVQRLRLIQALAGALTVVPVYLLTRQLFGRRRVALLAALLAALNYTLAASATELLTETLFVLGLATLLWLLVRAGASAGQPRALGWAALAGLALGGLTLLRSVALPLLPLGALWLLVTSMHRRGAAGAEVLKGSFHHAGTKDTETKKIGQTFVTFASLWLCPVIFLMSAALVIAPWTIRNYRAYGALIVVDTTGAENLWLDNNPAGATPADPLGREAAKRELYALGDDRAARQRLATAMGGAAIAGDPGWFARKAAGEGLKFFALQYFDDMRARRAIWVPPAEVWLRLLLGDGMWLLLLLAGAAGMWMYGGGRWGTGVRGQGLGVRSQESGVRGQRFGVRGEGSGVRGEGSGVRGQGSGVRGQGPTPITSNLTPITSNLAPITSNPSPITRFADPRWLLAPWAMYTLATAMLFHVELRYRLPLYPVLIPYAAWFIVDCRLQIADWRRRKSTIYSLQSAGIGVAITVAALISITLLHRPYAGESWMLALKHAQLGRAERALSAGDAAGAAAAAGAALERDPDSALAQVALARAALLRGDRPGALAALGRATAALSAQPYAHLLRGAILREQGDRAGAAAEFAYERSSQDDLQRWSWEACATFAAAPAKLAIGADDLGFVRGFWLPEPGGPRWTRAEAQALLAAPPGAGARLTIELSAGRPAGAAPARVSVLANGQPIGQIEPANEWRAYTLDLPAARSPGERTITITLRSDTFRPRDYDRASPDDRALGVLVRAVEVVAP